MNKENIMMIEYPTTIGDYKEWFVAIFNTDVISTEKAKAMIEQDDRSEEMIIVTKKQFENVFGEINEF